MRACLAVLLLAATAHAQAVQPTPVTVPAPVLHDLPPPPPVLAAAPPPEPRVRALLRKPWLWIAVIAAAGVLAAGITLGVVYSAPRPR